MHEHIALLCHVALRIDPRSRMDSTKHVLGLKHRCIFQEVLHSVSKTFFVSFTGKNLKCKSQLCESLKQLQSSKLRTAAQQHSQKQQCTHIGNIAKKLLHCVECCQVCKRESSIASATQKHHTVEIVQASTALASASNTSNAQITRTNVEYRIPLSISAVHFNQS